MDLSNQLSAIKSEKKREVLAVPVVIELPSNQVEQEIQRLSQSDMHYTDFMCLFGKLGSRGMTVDVMRRHSSFFEQYISPESDTMKSKGIDGALNDYENGYNHQVGTIPYVPKQKEQPVQNDTTDYFAKFQSSILDQKKEYPLPVAIVLLMQNEIKIPLLTLKSFSLWQGKQKSKKTTVLALLIAAMLKGQLPEEVTIAFIGKLDGVILFIDTEQGESYAARTMRLILKLAGLKESDKLIYCDFREYSPSERLKMIEAGIKGTPNVQLVVIDGLVDLMTDFMDAQQGHITITDILRWCSLYNIHIAGVLHQNKNDKNARAHVGSIGSQKCEIEVATEVDPEDRNQSLVTCINSRDLPFETFAIRWDKGSLPCINQEYHSTSSQEKRAVKNFDKNKEIVESIFKPFVSLSHADAISTIMNTTLKSKSTAKRLLGDFMEWRLVIKGEDGNYRLNTNEGSWVQVGSNEGS